MHVPLYLVHLGLYEANVAADLALRLQLLLPLRITGFLQSTAVGL